MSENQEETLKIFKVIQILLLCILLWIFVCMVLYGTKTGRWRKTAQTSSLNNGLIFIASVLTLLIQLLRLTVSLITYTLPGLEDDVCEFLFDFAVGTFAFVVWGTFGFLWARQRMIYNHPYVKPQVSKWIDWISKAAIVPLTVNAVGIGYTHIARDNYSNGTTGCIYKTENSSDVTKHNSMETIKLSLLLFFLFVQLVIAVLFLYPSKKVLLQRTANGLSGDYDSNQSGISKYRQWLVSLFSCGSLETSTSPIQMSVRRTMYCSFAMVMSNIVVTIVDLNVDLLPACSLTVFDMAIVFYAICIVMTFGFSQSVFTLFWPKCNRRVKSKAPIQTQDDDLVYEDETGVSVEPNVTSKA